MVIIRATRRLVKASTGQKGPATLLSAGPLPEVGPLGVWYANSVKLPFVGRSAVLFTSAETLLSVVVPGRSLRTTIPVFQDRVPALLRRLGLPEPWIDARVNELAPVHIARAGALTVDRTVLGSMIEKDLLIWNWACDAGTFDRLDFDAMEDGIAEFLQGALGLNRGEYGTPFEAVTALAVA